MLHFSNTRVSSSILSTTRIKCGIKCTVQNRLFLAAGSSWMIEIGGLQKEQLQFITTNMKPDLQGKEYMGTYVARFNVDLPNSDKAPPLSAVAPLLDIFSRMGYSLLSHNDEVKPNMNYLTWVLSKDTN